MKNTLIIIFFIFVIAIQIKAQDLTRSYALYLPAIVSENKEYHEQINASLQYYARLNPELIYYYIKYLDARFNQKISNLDSNYYNYLLAREKELVPERNEWVSEQKNQAWVYVNSWIEYRKIASLYNEFEAERSDATEVKITPETNEKLKDYFIYLYLSIPNHVNFDQNADYKKLITSRTKAITTNLGLANENATELSNTEKDSIVETALHYPFLLKSYSRKYFENTMDFELYELVDRLYKDEYSIKNEVFVTGSYLLGGIEGEENFNLSGERFPFYAGPNQYDLKVEARNNFNAGVGFKLKLIEKKSLLSYLKFVLLYGVGTVAENKSDYPRVRFLNTILPGRKAFRGNIYAEDISFSNKRYFQVMASFPVMWIFRDLSVEIGISYSNFNLDYSTSVRRDENPEVFNSDEPGDYDISPITKNYNISESEVWPFITLNYLFYDRFNLRATYIGPDLFSFGFDVVAFRF
jgi:hypothetical protein